MLNIKNILLPTDYSKCAAQALEHALYLARYYRARLHIIHAIVLHQEDPYNPAHHIPDPKELHEKLNSISRERMNSDLQAYVKGFKEEVINMEVLRGFSAADLILKYASEHDIDLIVIGTHGRRGLGYMFLGNIAQEVVRVARCPVYTVRESEKPKSPENKNVILSPVDFSDYSKSAISMAREAADLYGAKLELIHVVKNTLHSAYNIFGEKTILRLEQDIVDRYQKEMKQIFDTSPGPDIQAEFKVVTGHVVSEILEYARCNSIDLIVIATHGVTGLKHFFLGSVAEKVIRRSSCPVLNVKSFGKSLI